MPPQWECNPPRLEDMCTYLFLNYLHDEMNLIFHLKNFQDRSVLLKQHGLEPDRLIARLESQMTHYLTGILHDIVRQKMVDILISTLHTVSSSIQDLMGVCKPPPVLCKIPDIRPLVNFEPTTLNSGSKYLPSNPYTIHQYRTFPRLQLFELVLHKDLRILDFSQNKDWPPDGNDQMQDVSRNLWKIISERCQSLERLIIPKELTYSSTMNKIFLYGGSHLTSLTLKRNVPNNQFLSLIGQHCPKMRELDIAGADVVTDFGVVCLLFEDPEQIFLECWNREKTVGSIRRSQKSFPHPHMDLPIPDPTEHTPGHQGKCNTRYLHLKKSFYEAIRDTNYFWQKLPICNSLQKLRLENTKVKADGASVVLWCCKNIFSLGYLVFAAAGLKTVFGYEDKFETKFTEIFYRGPSDQKLQTIQNTCPKLKTMFLGSNSVRHLNASVFSHWPHLQYLTLENIIVDDVSACLELIGRQLKGLKIQCTGFDIMEIGEFCPNLVSLIIQKECPYTSMKTQRNKDNFVLFPRLLHLEITASFPKVCFSLIMKNAPNLKSAKVFELPGLRKDNLMEWIGHVQNLETLIIFRAPELGKEAVDLIMEACPKLTKLGDLQEMKKSQNDMKKLLQRIRDENWSLRLIDSQQGSDEKDFNKLLTLHWFYLTESSPSQSCISKES